MDISNIPQQLLKALDQKTSEQLQILSRVLNLVLGKTVMATVTSTAPITPQEREALLKETSAALAQVNKQLSSNPGSSMLKAEAVRLQQQQQLLQSPGLKWVQLTVNNKPLLTYTDRPLSPGQSTPVQLQAPQKLVMLDMPTSGTTSGKVDPSEPLLASLDKKPTQDAVQGLLKAVMDSLEQETSSARLINTTNSTPANTTSTNTTNANPVKVLISTTLANAINALPNSLGKQALQEVVRMGNLLINPEELNTPITDKPLAPMADTQQREIHTQIRNLMAYQGAGKPLWQAINQFSQLPTHERAQLLPPTIEQALKSLATQIRTPLELSNPKALAQSIKNSGIFFESSSRDIILPKLANTPQTTQTIPRELLSTPLNNLLRQDTKGALLTLISRIAQAQSSEALSPLTTTLARLLQQLTNIPPGTSTPPAADEGQEDDGLEKLMVQVLSHGDKPLPQDVRPQLLQLLQQQGLHNLAKIQLQQLHSLNPEQDSKEAHTSNASWQLEIPVKHHNEVHPLHVRLEREWVEDKEGLHHSPTPQKVRQWSVTLRFELPQLGEFCAQLLVIQQHVSATLWASREDTFSKAREQLTQLRQQLEQEGIQVKQLQCLQGMPAPRPVALSYSLIDIST